MQSSDISIPPIQRKHFLHFLTFLIAATFSGILSFSAQASNYPAACDTVSSHGLPDFSQCALHWSRELTLTAKQQIDLQKTDTIFLQENAKITNRIKELETQLQNQWRQDAADALISQTGNTLSQNQHKLFQVKLRNLEQVKKLLSPQQYRLLLRLMQKED
ncbi:hypothetical protein [Thiomicrorhabdus sp.]|uniref:hypothetical protein n=1 Tax=Thiomicrorhabdus sp. TaxID=2039724 RepID=UPI0029C85A41|nr:hypothetical protein [Thiomicrorhabdus sp.]